MSEGRINALQHTVGALNIQAEIARWFESRKREGANPGPKVVELMPLMFRTLDALYLVTRNLPIVGVSGANKNKSKDNPDAFTFGLVLEAHEYATLRSILALTGDLIFVSDNMQHLPGLLELGKSISDIYKRADNFRDARHFFTHMDEALRDHAKHGISGPVTLDCGVRFTDNAKNNVYVIWDHTTLYFSYDNKHCRVDIDNPEFNEIFNLARELYARIINNSISQDLKGLRDPNQVYTLK